MTATFRMLRKVNFIASIPGIMLEILLHMYSFIIPISNKMSRLTTKTLIAAHISGDVTFKFLIYHNRTLQITSRGLWEWRYQVGEWTNRVWRSCGDLLEWTMGHRLWWLLVNFWCPGGLQTAGIPHHRFDICIMGNAMYVLHSSTFKEVTDNVVCMDLWSITTQLQGWSPRTSVVIVFSL